MTMLHKEDAEALCKISLSWRYVFDSIIWLHNKYGMFTIKSAYKVARQVLKREDLAESSNGCAGKNVWVALWKLGLPNKIKVFRWRAYHDILPTWLNLIKWQIIIENGWFAAYFRNQPFTLCGSALLHKMFGLGVLKYCRRAASVKGDIVHLLEYLLDWISLEEMEIFLT